MSFSTLPITVHDCPFTMNVCFYSIAVHKCLCLINSSVSTLHSTLHECPFLIIVSVSTPMYFKNALCSQLFVSTLLQFTNALGTWLFLHYHSSWMPFPHDCLFLLYHILWMPFPLLMVHGYSCWWLSLLLHHCRTQTTVNELGHSRSPIKRRLRVWVCGDVSAL